MNILVTGGAGYIGSIIVDDLIKEGEKVIVYDNLEKGHRKAVKSKLIIGDLENFKLLDTVFRKYNINAVMHFAAYSLVEESKKLINEYYKNNVSKGIILLNIMKKYKVKKIIFSSSAAVYGQPKEIPITENSETNPINPYGKTKLIFENILKSYDKIYGIKFISLRYFNAAGASLDGSLGEDHKPETHLIPLILKVANDQSKHIKIFGTDYATKDGTCIRDYIHVIDLASAHILALKALNTSNIYNLGNEKGFSVKEVIKTAEKVTNKEIPTINYKRREGDPAVLIASSKKIKKEVKWKPKYYNLSKIIKTAWNWHKNHPHGYEK